MDYRPIVALLAAIVVLLSAEEEKPCSASSCYPATGNLLIGRKDKISASSTCGMQSRQRYCIVSHLVEQTKCFYCDSRQEWKPHREPYRNSHRIENIVSNPYEDRTRNWWQSENGVQNVTIRVDFEAEFHFTHLVMTFKSFRPYAMTIERSSDYGKTWHPYRYFSYDCDKSFPNITAGPPQKHTDVICTTKYSGLSPSTGGEVIYKVISPHIRTDNPYADEITKLLMITNLRIILKKLHTLGDDLLDYRPEIEEKYYYAIYDLVVRGSCSCYGHAQRCIPMDGVTDYENPDMVHGRCECTHNTQGLNCEECMDFFNDAPWRPAIANETNECRRCNCNGHASRCHFDKAVYEASGNVSGGVCDDCMHNTQGKNCEQCKLYYYRDPAREINDQYVCRPCECDKAGSNNDGICESEHDEERGLVAGKCYCKTNVEGSRCDRCKNGFWNMTQENANGCQACTCHLLGTYNNEGCDKYTGACTCKRNVRGENCDECLPEHYGMSDDPDGCKPCDCDFGGSYDNQCDLITGQCKCRDHFGGRRCDSTDSSYFCPNIDFNKYEAEYANFTNGILEAREIPASPRDRLWTGDGFVKVREGSSVIFNVDDLAQSMYYNLIIRYEAIPTDNVGWENIEIVVHRSGPPEASGPCANYMSTEDYQIARFDLRGRYYEVQGGGMCLEAGKSYQIEVRFGEKRTGQPDRTASVLIDSIVLSPPTESLDIFRRPENNYHLQEYKRYQCRNQVLSLTPQSDLSDTCVRYTCPVAASIFDKGISCDCDPTGSVSGICSANGGQCECKPNVVGRRCDACAVGTYGFGPSGCTPCACDSVGSLNNFCDEQSGQCECTEKGITGRQCNQCQPGFWSFPECKTCQCNDHASHCDQKTGACIECRDLTTGHNCERCQPGYYGDPRLGVNLKCKPCPCPGGPSSGKQHGDTCYRTYGPDNTQDVVCNCRTGYVGDRCGVCDVNYWGNPGEIGGSCQRCDCNGNIDFGVPDSCDAVTGECTKCLHNTEGPQCEHCVDGYYGDAQIRNCVRCSCNHLGTNSSAGSCDRITGQCPCFPNVDGLSCDKCAPEHFNMASGEGCSACACDPNGVVLDSEGKPHLQCNEIDGQCTCKRGRGGRTCSECEDYYWGNPVTGECKRCECNPTGSATMQCNREDGTCVCQPGSGGPLCDQCARGYTGHWPHCEACGECFNNWDKIITEQKAEVEKLIEQTNNIEDTGVASEYDERFAKMEANLDNIKDQLATANITKEDVDSIQARVTELQEALTKAKLDLQSTNDRITDLTTSVDNSEEIMKSLKEKEIQLDTDIEILHKNTTDLREADVQGAYNSTRESADKSQEAKRQTDEAVSMITEAENIGSRAEQLLDQHLNDFAIQFKENQDALAETSKKVYFLREIVPSLNEQVCGAKVFGCDDICGGPSKACGGVCGGDSCTDGSATLANQADQFALEASDMINSKQKTVTELREALQGVLFEIDQTRDESDRTYKTAENSAKQTNQTKTALKEILDQMKEFLEIEQSTPEQIRTLAEEISNMKISLTPDEIKNLADEINGLLSNMENTDNILAETHGNMTLAAQLEADAKLTSDSAASTRNATDSVKKMLEEAEFARVQAGEALKEAQENLDAVREMLGSDLLSDSEDIVKLRNDTLKDLDKTSEDLRVKYYQIMEKMRLATNAGDEADSLVQQTFEKLESLTAKRAEADELLKKHQKGNEAKRQRAENLRKRATVLLTNINSVNERIEQERQAKDASEVNLSEYQRQLVELNDRLEKVFKDIKARKDHYNSCG